MILDWPLTWDLKEAVNLSIGTGAAFAIGLAFGRKGTNELRDATKRVLRETDKLREESAKVRRLVRFVLIGLEEAKIISLTRDSNGEITGIYAFRIGLIKVEPTVTGNMTTLTSPKTEGDT